MRACRSAIRFVSSVVLVATLLAAGGCRDEDGIVVAELSFAGVRAVDEGRLRAALATQESAALPWGEKHYFDRAAFEADLERIEAFYADRGYPNAKIASFDVRLDEARKEARLRIVIDEGEPTLVEAIRLDGFDRLPAEHFAALREALPLKEGEPRDRQLVEASGQIATSELRDHGYPYAKVDAREEAGSSPSRVRLTFAATPGPIAYYGPIEVAGNSSVSDAVIRRQLTYRPGELFRVSQLEESQRRLYALELFEFVNVEAVGVQDRPAEARTRITVTEGKHRRVTFGIGYGTEEKLRGELQWRHVNFFGGARTAGVRGKWSSLDRGVRLDFNEPYFFRQGFSLDLNGQRWFADEPAYKLDTTGGRITVSHRSATRDPLARDRASTRLALSYIHEIEEFAIANEALLDLSLRDDLIALGLDPRTGAGRGTLAALAFDAQRSTTANLLDATRGYVASLHLEQAGWWLPSDFRYVEISGEARHYLTIARRAVVANRVRFGALDGLGAEERGLETTSVPFFKRYFLGGSTSLRGWGRFQVSPLSGAGLPLGGLTMLEVTSELRTPIAGNLGGVLFMDAGNVWPNAWELQLDDLRYALGAGVRYRTPVGPLRFDFGYQLTPIRGLLVGGEPQTRRWRIHFSIGQAF